MQRLEEIRQRERELRSKLGDITKQVIEANTVEDMVRVTAELKQHQAEIDKLEADFYKAYYDIYGEQFETNTRD